MKPHTAQPAVVGRDELGRMDWSRAVVLSAFGCACMWAVPLQILIHFVWVGPRHVCFL